MPSHKITQNTFLALLTASVGFFSYLGIFAATTLAQSESSQLWAQANRNGKFCNVQNRSGGWWLWFTSDARTDPCQLLLREHCSGTGCYVASQGMYVVNAKNKTQVTCQGYRESFVGSGDESLRQAYTAATNPFRPACRFQVSRVSTSGAIGMTQPPIPTPVTPQPAPSTTLASSPAPNTSTNQTINFAAELLRLTNAERQRAGLPPLRLSAQLNQAAQSHAEDMGRKNFFSHTGSNGSQQSDRVRTAGYAWSYVGENIAAGGATPAEAVQQWMNSPGHRANILKPEYTEIGFGYVNASSTPFQHYWVQVFGRP